MFQTQAPHATPNLPRQAEQGDARMALQRRGDEPGRRQNGQRGAGRGEIRNDETSVSIAGLQAFVETLLRTHDGGQERDVAGLSDAMKASAAQPQAPKRPNYASPSAQAARAYASASSHTLRRTPPMESALIVQNTPSALQNRPRLNAAEREQALRIKENLAVLTVRGLQYLAIQRGDTFLGSLLESTELALAQTASL